MFKSLLIATAITSALSAGSVLADTQAPKTAIYAITADGSKYYADANGMTLYTFDKDAKGVSNCNGGCAEKWPPLMAAANARKTGDFTVITRADGSKQWAYDGMALYTWFKDKARGDMTGDGVKGVWHVAKP